MIIRDEATFRRYYVVFERPVGSSVWTLAHKIADDGKSLVFLTLTSSVAAKFAHHVHYRKANNCARVACILLPDQIDDHCYAEI